MTLVALPLHQIGIGLDHFEIVDMLTRICHSIEELPQIDIRVEAISNLLVQKITKAAISEGIFNHKCHRRFKTSGHNCDFRSVGERSTTDW